MTIFPKNNLPTASLNWGREVERAVNNLESSFKTAEVNNVTRDSQLQSSYKRLDAALTELKTTTTAADNALSAAITAQTTANTANTTAISANSTAIAANTAATNANTKAIEALEDATQALQEIVSLGSPGGPTINASNITAGTINGINITGTNITGTSSITGATISGGSLTTSSGSLSATVANGSVSLSGPGGSGSLASTDFGLVLSSSNIVRVSAPSGIQGVTSDFASILGGDISVSGSITRTALNVPGSTLTGASLTATGALVRSTSSARYKTEIQPLEIDLEDVYAIEPKTFKRIEEVEEDPETATTYPGLIAEELAGTSLDKFVFYSQDEQGNSRPEGIHYPELAAALLLAIKDLNVRLAALEDRVQ